MPSDHHSPQYASAGEAFWQGSEVGTPLTRQTNPGWRWAYVRLTPTDPTMAVALLPPPSAAQAVVTPPPSSR